jgi:WD40 repeat protein
MPRSTGRCRCGRRAGDEKMVLRKKFATLGTFSLFSPLSSMDARPAAPSSPQAQSRKRQRAPHAPEAAASPAASAHASTKSSSSSSSAAHHAVALSAGAHVPPVPLSILPVRLVRDGYLGRCGDGAGLAPDALGAAAAVQASVGAPPHSPPSTDVDPSSSSSGAAAAAPPRFATCMDWSRVDCLLAVGCNDGAVSVWDCECSWAPVLRGVVGPGAVAAVALLHLPARSGGAVLVTLGAADGALRLWCTRTAALLASVETGGVGLSVAAWRGGVGGGTTADGLSSSSSSSSSSSTAAGAAEVSTAFIAVASTSGAMLVGVSFTAGAERPHGSSPVGALLPPPTATVTSLAPILVPASEVAEGNAGTAAAAVPGLPAEVAGDMVTHVFAHEETPSSAVVYAATSRGRLLALRVVAPAASGAEGVIPSLSCIGAVELPSASAVRSFSRLPPPPSFPSSSSSSPPPPYLLALTHDGALRVVDGDVSRWGAPTDPPGARPQAAPTTTSSSSAKKSVGAAKGKELAGESSLSRAPVVTTVCAAPSRIRFVASSPDGAFVYGVEEATGDAGGRSSNGEGRGLAKADGASSSDVPAPRVSVWVREGGSRPQQPVVYVEAVPGGVSIPSEVAMRAENAAAEASGAAASRGSSIPPLPVSATADLASSGGAGASSSTSASGSASASAPLLLAAHPLASRCSVAVACRDGRLAVLARDSPSLAASWGVWAPFLDAGPEQLSNTSYAEKEDEYDVVGQGTDPGVRQKQKRRAAAADEGRGAGGEDDSAMRSAAADSGGQDDHGPPIDVVGGAGATRRPVLPLPSVVGSVIVTPPTAPTSLHGPTLAALGGASATAAAAARLPTRLVPFASYLPATFATPVGALPGIAEAAPPPRVVSHSSSTPSSSSSAGGQGGNPRLPAALAGVPAAAAHRLHLTFQNAMQAASYQQQQTQQALGVPLRTWPPVAPPAGLPPPPAVLQTVVLSTTAFVAGAAAEAPSKQVHIDRREEEELLAVLDEDADDGEGEGEAAAADGGGLRRHRARVSALRAPSLLPTPALRKVGAVAGLMLEGLAGILSVTQRPVPAYSIPEDGEGEYAQDKGGGGDGKGR